MSLLYSFQDITTFTVYVNVTASDFEKSFSFNETFETAGHLRFSIHV